MPTRITIKPIARKQCTALFTVADIFDHLHRLLGFTVCIVPLYSTTVTQRLSTIITIDYLNDLTFAAAETFPTLMLTHNGFSKK